MEVSDSHALPCHRNWLVVILTLITYYFLPYLSPSPSSALDVLQTWFLTLPTTAWPTSLRRQRLSEARWGSETSPCPAPHTVSAHQSPSLPSTRTPEAASTVTPSMSLGTHLRFSCPSLWSPNAYFGPAVRGLIPFHGWSIWGHLRAFVENGQGNCRCWNVSLKTHRSLLLPGLALWCLS